MSNLANSERAAEIARRQERINALKIKKQKEEEAFAIPPANGSEHLGGDARPNIESDRRPQLDQLQGPIQQPPVDVLGVILQQKQKKLGVCQVEIYSTALPKSLQQEQEQVTVEFGIQCDLPMETALQQEDESMPIMEKPRRDSVKPRRKSIQQVQQPQAPQPEKRISAEEINSILHSNSFTKFFERTSKFIEKVINTRSEPNALEDLLTAPPLPTDQAKDLLSHSVSFFDPQYSDNRVVTSLQWAPHLPNTLLASYSQNEEGSITDQVGLALLWNLQLKSRPEFYLYASSPITSACFHPFSPNLVIGGLYNGQIVVWDLRAKHTPEKRTTLNSGGHSYPIYGLNIVGSQNAHNLVSCSNDGKVCLWNLSMLNQPQKITDLKTKTKVQQGSTALTEANVTCLEFPADDANNFFVGCEDGSLYKSKLHLNQNENALTSFDEHLAPVTGISINNSSMSNLSNLVLSSSCDWTVKLWNPRIPSENKCLTTFESSEDYVYDVKWNGVHPTLFSSVDGEGYVELWDVSIGSEAPITRFKTGSNSLNKCQWTKDGTKLAVGDAYGTVQILSLQQKSLRLDNDRIASYEQSLKIEK